MRQVFGLPKDKRNYFLMKARDLLVALVLGALLVGAIATVLGQLLVSRVLDFAAPLSVVINLVGGAYFIFLVMRRVRL